MMSIRIEQYELDIGTPEEIEREKKYRGTEEIAIEKKYTVFFNDDCIETTLTHDSVSVGRWFSEIQEVYNSEMDNLVVGLATKTSPNIYVSDSEPIPPDILQICVGKHCLIFQLTIFMQTDEEGIPEEVNDFFGQDSKTYAGIGVSDQLAELAEHYHIPEPERRGCKDLPAVAADLLGKDNLKTAGLEKLASEILLVDVGEALKPSDSMWYDEWLTDDQVQSACVEAFLCSQIWKHLRTRT